MSDSTWQDHSFVPPDLPATDNPTILAFSCYFHDSSACIVKNGRIVAAADEERFSRKKHDAGFPEHAIEYCKSVAAVDAVDFVAFYEDPSEKWSRIEETLRRYPPSQATRDQICRVWRERKSRDRIQETLHERAHIDNPIVFLDHHTCHAASSFFVSGFDEAAIATIDGIGERVTTAYGQGSGSDLQLTRCVHFPHSIGLLYTALTVFLGFKANDHEYKVMGLAAYGIMDRSRNPYYAKLLKMIHLHEDGSFLLDMRYFGHNTFDSTAYSELMSHVLGLHPNVRNGTITREHENLAAALQMVAEDAVLNVLRAVHRITNQENLCLAGGVALNSVLNGKILSSTGFKRLFIQPSAGDSGTVIGAAKYVQSIVDPDAPTEHTLHSSYGPEFSLTDIREFLIEHDVAFKEFLSDDEMLHEVARLIEERNVIGWFQGRMEWGPRALGNRSILASPLHTDMRDILNGKVKHRELFRPFAPVVCIDDAREFFECDIPVPEPTDYMLMVYPIRKSRQSTIPAVAHVDGSGRLQTVRESQNPLYYRLIKAFGARTGVPILVNTSFNIRGEPIVCTPRDAYRCMMGTEIDYLVMGRFMIARASNLKHSWQPVIED